MSQAGEAWRTANLLTAKLEVQNARDIFKVISDRARSGACFFWILASFFPLKSFFLLYMLLSFQDVE